MCVSVCLSMCIDQMSSSSYSSFQVSSLLSRYESLAYVSRFPTHLVRVWIQHITGSLSTYVPLTRVRWIRQDDIQHPNILLTWPLCTWLYIVVRTSSPAETYQVWGYISLAQLMYDSIVHLHSGKQYTHRLVYRNECTMSVPTPCMMPISNVLPLHFPSQELSIDQFMKFFHQRFVWYVHQINQDPKISSNVYIGDTQELSNDHIRFYTMKLCLIRFVSSNLLPCMTSFLVEAELALFQFRVATCWLPRWYTIWQHLLTYLSIPYKEQFFGPWPELLTMSPSPYEGYSRWWTMSFEHVDPSIWTQYKALMLEGQVWLHEAHLYASLPYYYKQYLLKYQFYDHWWIIPNGTRENAPRIEQLEAIRHPIERCLRLLVNKMLVGGGLANSHLTMPCAITYVAKYGPPCLQRMIHDIQSSSSSSSSSSTTITMINIFIHLYLHAV